MLKDLRRRQEELGWHFCAFACDNAIQLEVNARTTSCAFERAV